MSAQSDDKGWPTKPELGPDGMLVSVIKLRDHGRRISRQEMEDTAPLVGMIKIEETSASPGMIAHRRIANLGNPNGTPGTVSIPLFDPVLERWTVEGLVISGYEINAVDLVAIQHVQVWLVRIVHQ